MDAIVGAKRPMILAGNGAIRKRASTQLRRLAELTGIGVVNTFMGKGAVPRSDEHCLFTVGLQGKDHIIAALREADVIVSVGYDLVEYSPAFWNRGVEKTIVHIDFWPAEVDGDYDVAVDVQGDIADALWQINEEIERRARDGGPSLPLFDIGERQALRHTIHDDSHRREGQQPLSHAPAEGAPRRARVHGAGRRAALRRGRAQDVDRPLLPVRRAQHLPHLQRLLHDGLRLSRLIGGQDRHARAPRPLDQTATPGSS